MVFCTSTITPAEGSTAESSSTARIGLEEVAALPAVFLGDFDAHQAHLEELADDVFAEHAGFVHLADMGADFLARELAHGGLEELLVFAQRGQRLRRGCGAFGCRHVGQLTPQPPVRATAFPGIPPPRRG